MGNLVDINKLVEVFSQDIVSSNVFRFKRLMAANDLLMTAVNVSGIDYDSLILSHYINYSDDERYIFIIPYDGPELDYIGAVHTAYVYNKPSVLCFINLNSETKDDDSGNIAFKAMIKLYYDSIHMAIFNDDSKIYTDPIRTITEHDFVKYPYLTIVKTVIPYMVLLYVFQSIANTKFKRMEFINFLNEIYKYWCTVELSGEIYLTIGKPLLNRIKLDILNSDNSIGIAQSYLNELFAQNKLISYMKTTEELYKEKE